MCIYIYIYVYVYVYVYIYMYTCICICIYVYVYMYMYIYYNLYIYDTSLHHMYHVTGCLRMAGLVLPLPQGLATNSFSENGAERQQNTET